MLLPIVYPVIQGFILFVVMIVVILMILRLIFNFRDPNPFSVIGRFSRRLKKATDEIVYPSAGLLAHMRIDTRYAPLITILGVIVIGYFTLQLFYTLFFTIDGIVANAVGGSVTKIVGFILYGALGFLSLAIIIRIVLSYVMSIGNPVLRFLRKITDPILEPFRRLIPPLGMFDISAIIVLILLNFLQAAVVGVFNLR
jgi:YggT family protein